MELNLTKHLLLNVDIVQERYSKIDADTIISGALVDDISNAEISDIIAFTEAIKTKEYEAKNASRKNFFTVDYDREEELPILFRQSYHDYANTDRSYSYFEYVMEWLGIYDDAIQKQRAHSQDPTEFIECCPNCGGEIDITLPGDSKEIPFCPYCGQPHVLLCSECMEVIGDCHRNDPKAFCYGKKEG